jgi:hypothetical protein
MGRSSPRVAVRVIPGRGRNTDDFSRGGVIAAQPNCSQTLRVVDGRIAEITTFSSTLASAFGLAETL